MATPAWAFTAQVTAFSDAGCDVVFTITVAFETHGVLAEANAQGFDPIWLGALPSYVSLLALGNRQRVVEDMGMSAIQLFGVMSSIFLGISLLSSEIDRALRRSENDIDVIAID